MIALGIILRSATIWLSAIVCLIVLGGFGAWAAMAPLSEGVIAYGQLSVENNRKTVQHLEGGIIQEVLVVEGQPVDKGQALLVLTDTAVSSGRDQVAFELANAQASVDRLNSLIDGRDAIIFGAFSNDLASQEIIDEIERRQSDLFHQQRRRQAADLNLLDSRKRSLEGQVEALDAQLSSNTTALEFLSSEIKRNSELLDTQLIRATELANLERDRIQLESERARIETDRTLAQSRIDEIDGEIGQLRARFAEELSREVVEARRQVLSLTEQLSAAQDVVNRTVIEAPQDGEILNLRFTTAGGVVRPGEPIMEIVPSNSELIAIVQIRPLDRETVYEGLEVDARLSSTNSWHAALYAGEIEGISADLKTSPDGASSYYEARISLKRLKSENTEIEPVPGMPVEAFVYSGRERTFVEYITEPLLATFRRGGRE